MQSTLRDMSAVTGGTGSDRSVDENVRHDWTFEEVQELYNMPFLDLVSRASRLHREYFNPREVQISTLMSIKTGGCSENCGYCSQSAHFDTGVKAEKLVGTSDVLFQAQKAKESGATRFCMGAAWSAVKDRDMPKIISMIEAVKSLGMESCMTLGMLDAEKAARLKEAGLDYYNHNIDTSREYYDKVVTTRTYEDRLHTLEYVRDAGIKVCAGGIVGMGESRVDRVNMLITLANLPQHPHSVPINLLVAVAGTPLGDKSLEGDDSATADKVDIFEFVRTIAVARILMPRSYVRLSAGRENISDEGQALCFLAGANSIFYGERLLTTNNTATNKDKELLGKLGLIFG